MLTDAAPIASSPRTESQALPWLKLVASLREPISRFLSMLGHNVDKSNYNCLLK